MHFGSGHETQESFAHWIEENYVSQSLSPIDKQQLADECAQECSFEMIIKNVKYSKIIVVLGLGMVRSSYSVLHT